jgi:hypothetical protein
MTVTPQEIEAMKKVLGNLSSITDQRPPQSGERSQNFAQSSGAKAKDPDSQAMLDILTRLSRVNEQTREVISESTDVVNKQLASTEQTASGVKIANYIVDIVESHVNGTVKNTYTITEAATGNVLYSDLALYESVMAITKQLLKNPAAAFVKCNTIARLDEDYARHFYEAMSYKQRIQRTNDLDKRSLYESKYSRSVGMAKDAKRNILKSY